MDKKTILYVEDNLANRILIRRVLVAEGYEVVEAENFQTWLNSEKGETKQLAIADGDEQ